jgi:regulator of protease activity HflC (stomatin/prohibitin superfamily)
MVFGFYLTGAIILIILLGIRIVRPTHKLLVETLGKYRATKEQGFSWIIPIIQRTRYVNVTEQMVDVLPQTVITKDNLNAVVDAVVYYKIKDVKASQYNVDNHEQQLTSLTRTTLRAVIGKMTLTEANENRDDINRRVESVLDKETESYGVEVLRVELQRIEPPQDVQQSMNEVVKAERKRIASSELANAVEIEADGRRRASIKEADGNKQASILEAEGKAKAFKLINESFKGNAQLDKKLDVTRDSLSNNSKIILTDKGISPQIILGDIPIKSKD